MGICNALVWGTHILATIVRHSLLYLTIDLKDTRYVHYNCL